MFKLPIKSSFVFLVFFFFSLFFVYHKEALADFKPAEGDPDINIRLRGWVPSSPSPEGANLFNHTDPGLISLIDSKAPQLSTLVGDGVNTNPSIDGARLFQIKDYTGSAPIPANGHGNRGVTLMGINNSGTVRVPVSGYDIGKGYQVIVLYATNTDVVINYTAGEGGPNGSPIEKGYTLHVLNLNTNPEIVNLYNQAKAKEKYIALPCGYNLGSTTSSMIFSIRDTGTFLSPRSRLDWWHNPVTTCEDLPPLEIEPGKSPGPAIITSSESPIPKPYVACGETRPDFLHPDEKEFNSLRPYQASPCDTQVHDTVLYCGNDFVLKKPIVVTPAEAVTPCEPTSNGGQKCHFEKTMQSWITITFPESELPIMGNTELVPNSINKNSALTALTRMNEYVSWFLNGVPFRAEETPGKLESMGGDEIVNNGGLNVTGNIGKVLAIGDSITIGSTGVSYTCGLDKLMGSTPHEFIGSQNVYNCSLKTEGYSGNTTANLLSKLSNLSNTNGWQNPDVAIIHLGSNDVAQFMNTTASVNNIKGIIDLLRKKNPNVKIILSQIIPILALGQNTTDMQPGWADLNSKIASLAQQVNTSDSTVVTVSFDEMKGNADYYIKSGGGTQDAAHPSQKGADLMAQKYYDAITGNVNNTTTPSSSTTGEYNILDFAGPLRKLLSRESQETQREKQVAAAGSTRHNQIIDCFIPLAGNPVPCYQGAFATLNKERVKNPVSGGKGYREETKQFVPMSSTEDRLGEVAVPDPDKITAQPPSDVALHWVHFNPTLAGNDIEKLFFAHMEESSQLASLLQNTFIPVGAPATTGNNGSPEYYNTERCEKSEKATNPGDKLFGDTHLKEVEQKLVPISGRLYFVADFDCEFLPDRFDPTCFANCMTAGGEETDCRNQCTKFAERTCEKEAVVAMSVFTRTPKIGDVWDRLVNGGFSIFKRMYPKGFSEIKDIPGYTNAEYTAFGMDPNMSEADKSKPEEVLAGEPNMNRPGKEAEIFFPHLGSIQQYFLYGIQKALRPLSDIASISVPGDDVVVNPEGCTAPQPFSQELNSVVDQAIARGEAASKVPKALLQAIYWIESFTYYISPEDYTCTKNPYTALGWMQITDSARDWVVPPDQRPDQEESVCSEVKGKLNRCNPVDELEMAARVLLIKVGKWDFQNFRPTGTISSKNDIYKAAWGYYGSDCPDKLTQGFANNHFQQSECRDDGCNNMGYADIVCASMKICPSWPAHRTGCGQ